jgi:hypothetical protein
MACKSTLTDLDLDVWAGMDVVKPGWVSTAALV